MPRAIRLLAALAAASAALAAWPVSAQSGNCQDGAKYMQARVTILDQLKAAVGQNKQVDPRKTCPLFTKMVANGAEGTKWLTSNKDWCQVPPNVTEGFTSEFAQMQKLKAAHCTAALKINDMEKKVKEQQQRGDPRGLMGGGALTSDFPLPKGAL